MIATEGTEKLYLDDMSNDIRQRRDEREVFEKFASICPIGICLDSIRHQDPPKPDILCKDADGNIIEFELGEAVDQNFQRQTNLSIEQTLIGMRDYFESLTGVEKENFSKLYGDAILHFSFRRDATRIRRQNAYPTMFSFLLSLIPGYEGDVKDSAHGFPSICKRITINRGVNGPFFNESHASHITPGVHEIIKSKFGNSYDTTGQLELLVHSLNRPLITKKVWISKVQKYLEKNMNASQFKRVWIFDFHGPSIEYVYQEFNANL